MVQVFSNFHILIPPTHRWATVSDFYLALLFKSKTIPKFVFSRPANGWGLYCKKIIMEIYITTCFPCYLSNLDMYRPNDVCRRQRFEALVKCNGQAGGSMENLQAGQLACSIAAASLGRMCMSCTYCGVVY